MELAIAIAFILLTSVILVVSLFYISTTTRHKERMALIEKGLSPGEHIRDRYWMNAIKAGLLATGVGTGFLLALFIDENIIPHIDNPAIYPGMIFLSGGLGLVLFYALFNKKDQN